MPPVINQETKEEIAKIRELVREKELKWQKRKEEKNCENIAKQSASEAHEPMRTRTSSYTLLKPTFSSNLLPKVSIETSDSDKETVVDAPLSMQSFISEVDEYATNKNSKDLKNELDRSTSTPRSPFLESIVPQVNFQLKELIEKQKREYLHAMEALKNKFTNEQHDLIMSIHSNLLVTSTPLNSSVIPCTSDDESEFTEFKTCLRSQSLSLEEKTIVNSHEAQVKAATTINAYTRGFLTRRLLKTIYVQEHVKNIKKTLQVVLNLDDHQISKTGSPVQNILLKAKLFRQLQTDLYNFHEIFSNYSTKEKLKIISADQEIRRNKQDEDNKENLNLSFHNII